MRYPIQGYEVDKNELPEVFGEALKMWVLAPRARPSDLLLCTPDHPSAEQSTEALRGTRLQPGDCFFRTCMVTVTGSREAAIGADGEPRSAWQLPNGTYVVERVP